MDVPEFHPQRYRMLDHIGAGGMADVYLADDTILGRRVVLKRLKDHLLAQPHFVTMFLDEARTVAKLNHPNIISVYDIGRSSEDNGLFIAMEYLEGNDLLRIFEMCLEADRPFDVAATVRIIADVCAGLHSAHTACTADGQPLDLVHRDISPQNVFVTVGGIVKILDFGIAKTSVRRARTEAGKLRGKFAYMSPEHLEGQTIDARSDIFSLGIVLHEFLSGRQLFAGLSLRDAHDAIVRIPVPPPIRIRDPLPEPIVEITRRALQRDPSQRYADAAQFGQALETALHNLPGPPPNVASCLQALHARAMPFDDEPTAVSMRTKRRTTYAFGRLDSDDGNDDGADDDTADLAYRHSSPGGPRRGGATRPVTDLVESPGQARPASGVAAPSRGATVRISAPRLRSMAAAARRNIGVGGALLAVVVATAPSAAMLGDLRWHIFSQRLTRLATCDVPAWLPLLPDGAPAAAAGGGISRPTVVEVHPADTSATPTAAADGSAGDRRNVDSNAAVDSSGAVPAGAGIAGAGIAGAEIAGAETAGETAGARDAAATANAPATATSGNVVGAVPAAVGANERRVPSAEHPTATESGASGSDTAARAKDDRPGWLSLNTDPVVQAFYRGRLLGSTPLRRQRLPAGTVELHLVSAQHGIDVTRSVSIGAARHVEKRWVLRRPRTTKGGGKTGGK